MKKIYMVQASDTYVGNNFKAAYFPYAVGLLIAYAFENETVKQNYEFGRFIFTRENTDEVVSSLDSPAVVGFSNYVWNTQYNLALAEKIKKKYPDCKILFGGHNVPPDGDFLEKYPFIDFLMHGEGEEAFLNLLLAFNDSEADYSQIKNISYRLNDGKTATNPTEILTKTDYPSPYLNGWFNDIIRQNPDMQLDAIIETSRGCPGRCAYCDWGCTASKIKFFPLERVFAEIDWFSKHKVAFIWIADSNFGASERDEKITERIVNLKETTGFPERVKTNYAKNNMERVFRITQMLEKEYISKEGATISFQSLNPDTLKAIGRTNMNMESFRKQMQTYRNAGVITYSELILGLPLETYDSFCEGIDLLLENGQHRLIKVYNCVLLPNSAMAKKDYRNKYNIKTIKTSFLSLYSGQNNAEIPEHIEYVVETDSMNKEQWIKANIFACCEKCFHHFGLLRSFAIYCFYEKNIRYKDFYNAAINFIKESKNPLLHNAWEILNKYFSALVEEKPISLYSNTTYGDITWEIERVPLLETIYRLDEYYAAVSELLLQIGIDSEILNELIEYQKCILKCPNRNHFSCDFNYDWHGYFTDIINGNYQPLQKIKTRVSVDNQKDLNNWEAYALNAVWFGKDGGTFNPGIHSEII